MVNKNNKKTNKKINNDYFLIEDIREVMFNEDENFYQNRINEIIELIKSNILNRKLLCKITLTKNTTKEMTLGNYLTYLILLSPFYYFDEEPTDDMIFDILPIKNFENYLDKVIKVFGIDRYEENEEEDTISIIGEIIIEAINKLNKISYIITSAYAPTFSLYQFIELAKRNKRFEEILYEPDKLFHNNDTFDMKEIVDHTKQICKEIIDIITTDDENTFKYWILSGSGVKPEQFAQIFGFIGAKPDLKEKIIPKEIASNFAMGLRNVQDFYINSIGCLKALITSHIQVKNSGYFTRKLEILLNDEFIADVEDCGTKHLVPLTIKDISYIEKLRFRKFSKYPSGKNLQTFVDGEDYSDLVGKTIYLRDPITCACEEGICKTCYGDLWKITHDLNIGIIACLIMTNEFTQTMLSTKHLLQAKIKKREYPTAFIKYFEFNRDKIVLKEKYSKVKIEIELDDIDDDEELDSEELKIEKFKIIDDDKEYIIDSDVPLYINEEIREDIDSFFNRNSSSYIFKGKDLNDYDYLFSHSIDNNGLSRTMLLVKDIIDKNNFIMQHTVFELYERFTDLIMESGSTIDFVHISVIIKNMMKVKEGRNAFTNKEEPQYDLYKISDAIQFNSKSISKPILFECVKKQLLLDQFGTFKKNGISSHDELLR